MTKNSGDWEGLQGHDDHPAQFKHKAWVHEGGGSIYIYGCVCIFICIYTCICIWCLNMCVCTHIQISKSFSSGLDENIMRELH